MPTPVVERHDEENGGGEHDEQVEAQDDHGQLVLRRLLLDAALDAHAQAVGVRAEHEGEGADDEERAADDVMAWGGSQG